MKSLTQFINENWFNRLTSTGMKAGSAAVSYVASLLRQAAKDKNFDAADFRVKYDEKKQAVYINNYQDCEWAFIADLKDGVVINNIKNDYINDKEEKKLEELIDKTSFGRQCAQFKKDALEALDRAAKQKEADAKNPAKKYAKYADNKGYEWLKKDSGIKKGQQYKVLTIPTDNKYRKELGDKLYFLFRDDAMQAVNDLGIDKDDIMIKSIEF